GATAGRSLTLNPVNVTGKPKLKLTFALAGTEVDFDGPGGDDYVSIKVDLKNSGEFIELARYGSPTATEKFLVEMIKGGDGMGGPPELVIPDYTKRVGIVAKDFTYDIPDGATKLVVRFEGLSTFWNEIMAFENIRITSGDLTPASDKLAISAGDGKVTITYSGTLQSSDNVASGYTDVAGATSPYTTPHTDTARFYRTRQ